MERLLWCADGGLHGREGCSIHKDGCSYSYLSTARGRTWTAFQATRVAMRMARAMEPPTRLATTAGSRLVVLLKTNLPSSTTPPAASSVATNEPTAPMMPF